MTELDGTQLDDTHADGTHADGSPADRTHADRTQLDGNALAGDLREIFAVDVTAAKFTCAGCGHADAVATLRLWGPAPGRIGRCPSCADVVVRLAPGRVFLDLRGTVRLELPVPGELSGT